MCREIVTPTWINWPSLSLLPLSGRKTGKGCYVYSGKRGKDRSVNEEAAAIVEKYKIPISGRYGVGNNWN